MVASHTLSNRLSSYPISGRLDRLAAKCSNTVISSDTGGSMRTRLSCPIRNPSWYPSSGHFSDYYLLVSNAEILFPAVIMSLPSPVSPRTCTSFWSGSGMRGGRMSREECRPVKISGQAHSSSFTFFDDSLHDFYPSCPFPRSRLAALLRPILSPLEPSRITDE